jgi:hypothetical protein
MGRWVHGDDRDGWKYEKLSGWLAGLVAGY